MSVRCGSVPVLEWNGKWWWLSLQRGGIIVNLCWFSWSCKSRDSNGHEITPVMTITTNHNRHEWRQYIDRPAAPDAETVLMLSRSLLLIRRLTEYYVLNYISWLRSLSGRSVAQLYTASVTHFQTVLLFETLSLPHCRNTHFTAFGFRCHQINSLTPHLNWTPTHIGVARGAVVHMHPLGRDKNSGA